MDNKVYLDIDLEQKPPAAIELVYPLILLVIFLFVSYASNRTSFPSSICIATAAMFTVPVSSGYPPPPA